MDSNTKDAKEAKGFIVTLTVDVLFIHYHHAKDTLPTGTLKNFLNGTKWNENDLKRLGLIT